MSLPEAGGQPPEKKRISSITTKLRDVFFGNYLYSSHDDSLNPTNSVRSRGSQSTSFLSWLGERNQTSKDIDASEAAKDTSLFSWRRSRKVDRSGTLAQNDLIQPVPVESYVERPLALNIAAEVPANVQPVESTAESEVPSRVLPSDTKVNKKKVQSPSPKTDVKDTSRWYDNAVVGGPLTAMAGIIGIINTQTTGGLWGWIAAGASITAATGIGIATTRMTRKEIQKDLQKYGTASVIKPKSHWIDRFLRSADKWAGAVNPAANGIGAHGAYKFASQEPGILQAFAEMTTSIAVQTFNGLRHDIRSRTR